MTTKEREKRCVATCLHESAHATAAILQGIPVRCARVWEFPIDGELGSVLFEGRLDSKRATPERLIAHAVVFFAGWLSETAGAMGQVKRVAGDVRCEGEDLRHVNRAIAHHPNCRGEHSARALLETVEQRAEELLVKHWPAVLATAMRLDRVAVLSGAEVREVMADPGPVLASGWWTIEGDQVPATFLPTARQRELVLRAFEEIAGPLPQKPRVRRKPRTPRVPNLGSLLRTKSGKRIAGMLPDGTMHRIVRIEP